MAKKTERKTDRRTLYTKSVIREAFLRLKAVRAFDSITVAEICREADINRGTFYLHYGNISDVLNEVLDEAMENVGNIFSMLGPEGEREGCEHPFCLFIRENKKYRCLFFDDSLGPSIINRIITAYKSQHVEKLQTLAGLTREQAEAVICFQMNGCFAMCKREAKLDGCQWGAVRGVIDRFIKGGLEALAAQGSPCAES